MSKITNDDLTRSCTRMATVGVKGLNRVLEDCQRNLWSLTDGQLARVIVTWTVRSHARCTTIQDSTHFYIQCPSEQGVA